MFKKIAIGVLVLAIALLMFLFSRLNPGVIEVDLAFDTFESSIPLAFTLAFVVGWVFGLASMAAIAARLANERRQLRRALRLSESEVHSLRNLPLADAD